METTEKTTNDIHGHTGEGWYGFDLDGTLAMYDGWKGIDHIGEPIKPMVELMKRMHDAGEAVKIMTARVAPRDVPEMRPNPYFESGVPGYVPQNNSTLKYLYCTRLWSAKMFVRDWCLEHLGFLPEITHQKDGMMITLYDDRVKQVVPNEGTLVEDLVPKPDPDWSEKCARCMEDGLNDDEECEYYGEPCGCNSPIYGQHPKTKSWNTSAIREALEDILAAAERMAADELSQTHYKMNRPFIDGIIIKAKKGLAKPARNCDKYTDEESAQTAFLNDVWLISVDSTKDDPFDEWTELMKAEYAKWLMKPVEKQDENPG